MDVCSPQQVADYLLVESRKRGEALTNLKLQKLLYYEQAWFLALNDGPLFEEDFQAWIHGPVLPSQYSRFSQWRWRPIMDEVDSPGGIASTVKLHLEEVLNVFGTETAMALEQMTHHEQPWLEARGNLPVDMPSEEIIEKNAMRDFYRSL